MVEDRPKVDHVSSKHVQWHVDDWCESHGRCLMVEETRQSVSHGSRRLNHHHDNKVKCDELAECVCEPNREVEHKIHEKWDKEHDWDLCEELGSRIDPDVIHARVTLSHINWFLMLKHNNSRLEI